VNTRFSEAHPTFSPDGRWIAYSSDESGRFEAYVQRYPLTRERWKISDGGTKPVWSPTGAELFYEYGRKRMVAAISREPTFVAGKPQVFAEGAFIPVPGRSFDIERDGRRLLLIRELSQATASEVRIVFNWFDELMTQMPIR
jgi:hypothetical protein